jgi:NADP-dependent 3-hydroxy acid dehydrogenase YdfG
MKNLREDDWERTVDVNCKGAMNCIGAVLRGMLARGQGHIVTISSDAGRKVFPGLSVHSGSKFFVEALSQGLRLETAGTGIKVTTIQPGNVATDLLALSSDEEALKLYGQQSGARVLDPEDVAASVVHALRQPDHVTVNEILVEPRDEPV